MGAQIMAARRSQNPNGNLETGRRSGGAGAARGQEKCVLSAVESSGKTHHE